LLGCFILFVLFLFSSNGDFGYGRLGGMRVIGCWDVKKPKNKVFQMSYPTFFPIQDMIHLSIYKGFDTYFFQYKNDFYDR
jgi:hypothetical protein